MEWPSILIIEELEVAIFESLFRVLNLFTKRLALIPLVDPKRFVLKGVNSILKEFEELKHGNERMEG